MTTKRPKMKKNDVPGNSIKYPKPVFIKNKYSMKNVHISVDLLENDLAALKVNRVKLYHLKKIVFKETLDHFGVHSLQLRIKPLLKSQSYKIALKRLFDVYWSRYFNQKAHHLMYRFRNARNMHCWVDLYWNTCFEQLQYFIKYVWHLRTHFSFTIKREPRQHCIEPFWKFFKSLRYLALKSLDYKGSFFQGHDIRETVKFRLLEKLVLVIGDRVQIQGEDLLWTLSKLQKLNTLSLGCNINTISEIAQNFKCPEKLRNLTWIYYGNNEYELIQWLASRNLLETVLLEVSLKSWFNGISQLLTPLPYIHTTKGTRVELSCDVPCLENIGQERFFKSLLKLQDIKHFSISFPEVKAPLACLGRHINTLPQLESLEVSFNFEQELFQDFMLNTKDLNNLKKLALLMTFEGPVRMQIPALFYEWIATKKELRQFKFEKWSRYTIDVPELTSDDILNLFTPLSQLEHLTHLCIRLSGLTIKNANKFAQNVVSDCLKDLKHLEAFKLYFPDNYLKDSELRRILDALTLLRGLSSLKIEGDFSKVSRNGMKSLVKFLGGTSHRLRHLVIRPKEYKGMYQAELTDTVNKAKMYRLLRLYRAKFQQYQQYHLA